eukprot:8336456-Alexandrium_andersonii.AAC.1
MQDRQGGEQNQGAQHSQEEKHARMLLMRLRSSLQAERGHWLTLKREEERGGRGRGRGRAR